MRLKILFPFVFFLLKFDQIESTKIQIIEDRNFNPSLEIYCTSNDLVPLKNLSVYKSKAENMTLFYIKYCKASSFVEMFESLDIANKKISKELFLSDMSDLESHHLTGVDEVGVQKLSVTYFHKRNIPKIDVFSTIFKLKKLIVEAPSDKDLPDLSKLKILEELSFTSNTVGNYLKVDDKWLTYVLKNVTDNLRSLTMELGDFVTKPPTWHLDENFFFKMISLENVSIIRNIKSLHKNVFVPLVNLTVLKLTHHDLKEFNPNLISQSLRILDLSDNKLESFILTRSFSNLVRIYLTKNHLKSFDLNLQTQLPKLEGLTLSENRLTQFLVHGSDSNHQLKTLYLNKNFIESSDIWLWAYKNKNQFSTDLSQNYPLCDCNYITELQKLNNNPLLSSMYDLDYCRIKLPDKFIKIDLNTLPCSMETTFTKSNCTVNLAHNEDQVEILIVNCSDITKTQIQNEILELIMDLDHHDLLSKDSPGDIYLIFDNNPTMKCLPKLTGIFNNYSKKTIHILARNSSISTVSMDNLPEGNLAQLLLSNNKIENIELNVLNHLFNVMRTNMTLSQNPLQCDCSHSNMYNEIIRHEKFIMDFEEIRCVDGKSFTFGQQLCLKWIIFLYLILSLVTVVAILFLMYLHNFMKTKDFIYSRGWIPRILQTDPDDDEYMLENHY